MPDELRLDYRTSGPVFSKREELVLWAKDDGTIHTTDQDGTDVEIGAGGGGGGLDVLGPYTIDWDNPGVNSASIELAPLAQGVVVIRAWAFVTEAWVTDQGDGFQFAIGLGAAGADWYVTDYPNSNGSLQSFEAPGSSLVPATEWGTRVAAVTGADWKLWGDVWINGSGTLESGSLDIYALVYTP